MRTHRWLVVAVVAAACGGQVPAGGTQDTAAAGAAAAFVAGGTFDLPAAEAFEDPGFHRTITATATTAAATTGTLVLRLRDAARPGVTCNREHPLSGCATVDWSDFEGRPRVPAGGVFDNRVVVETTAGQTTLYLSESGVMGTSSDDYAPG